MPGRSFIKDTKGDALVEAAILFPVMIMIFAALVLLAMYLPTRAALQRATQYAATAIATESSDTWLFYDTESMSYYRETDKDRLRNVYAALFTSTGDAVAKGEAIVKGIESRSLSYKEGELEVLCYPNNYIVYTEVVVIAGRRFTVPVDLSFIHFPKEIYVVVTSTAVVQNGDEFVRNMDLAAEFTKFLSEKLGLNDVFDGIGSSWGKVRSFFGW